MSLDFRKESLIEVAQSEYASNAVAHAMKAEDSNDESPFLSDSKVCYLERFCLWLRSSERSNAFMDVKFRNNGALFMISH